MLSFLLCHARSLLSGGAIEVAVKGNLTIEQLSDRMSKQLDMQEKKLFEDVSAFHSAM